MLTEMQAAEIDCFKEAIRRLKIGYSQFCNALSRQDNSVQSESPRAVCWGIYGALNASSIARIEAINRIRRKINISLSEWSEKNGRTQEAIIDLMECCLSDLEKEIAHANRTAYT